MPNKEINDDCNIEGTYQSNYPGNCSKWKI